MKILFLLSKQAWNFGFKDVQSPWMLIVANELMIKKTYLEKKEYGKISKITSADDNKSLHYKNIFDMKQNLLQGKQLSISRYGGLMGLPPSILLWRES